MKISDIVYSTVTNKCPRCHKGKVFVNNNPYSFKNGLTMNKYCPHCNLKYEREVGYFYGAMYVSYLIQVFFLAICFTLSAIWLHLESFTLVMMIVGITFPLFPVTFRSSRIAWIAFFTEYEKQYDKEKNEREEH